MSTPTELPQLPQASAPPITETEQNLLIPGNLPDITPRYRIESGAKHSTWLVDCGYQSAAQLDLQAGPYTLTRITETTEARVKAAERLCSLVSHPAVLRIDAVTTSQGSHHIWYEPAEAGSLTDYCRAKGKLPLGQVTTVARGLVQALSYLHEQGFAYGALTAQDCVLTVRGELKLLAPDCDTRALEPAVQKSKQADDIAACAALIWLCLTGEEPKAMRLRAPLNLAVPQASDALAQTLEDAIDSRAQQPQLTDLLALLELAADPEPLELHLSAHQSVRSRLPAYRPPAPAEPRRSLAQRRQVYGKLPDFSRGSKAKARKPSRSKPVGQGASQLPLGRFIRERWAISGAVLIGALALGGVGYQLSFAEGQGEDAVTAPSQAPHSLPDLDLPEAGQQLAGGAQQIADGQERAPASELTNDDLALEAAQLVASRSRVLASGDIERISDYAVMDSPLAEADRQLLVSQGAADLAGMSTELLAVAEVTQTDQGFKVRGTVQATGYTPTASGEELAAQGIRVEEGKVLQQVELTLQIQGGSYLLAQAQPLALEQPEP